MKRKYDTSKPTTITNTPIPKGDWKLMKELSKKKGILRDTAHIEAVREWNERNQGVG